MNKNYYEEDEYLEMEEKDHPMQGVSYSHPSFCQIQASRVSGGASNLYGSRASHQHKVAIRIFTSKHIVEDYFQERFFGDRKEIIEVEMTESQWATFISTMNVGMGTPCTLGRLQGERIPPPPIPVSHKEHFDEQVKDKYRKILKELNEKLNKALEQIDEMKISNKMKESLKKNIALPFQHFESNSEFFVECMEEEKEKIVTTAKQEIEAAVTHARMNISQDSYGQIPDCSIEVKKIEE